MTDAATLNKKTKRKAFPNVNDLCVCGAERFKHYAKRGRCLVPGCPCENYVGLNPYDPDGAAKAAFTASLPTGDKGTIAPGHTTWDDLGPRAKDRWRRIAKAVKESQ